MVPTPLGVGIFTLVNYCIDLLQFRVKYDIM